MTDTVNVPRELLTDLVSLDRDKRINAERGLYAMLANAPAQPAQTQGWQMVPVEPSEKMLDILYHNGPGLSDHLLVDIWAELLAAAPKPSDDVAKDAARWQLRAEVLRQLYNSTLTDEELDIAIDAAMEQGGSDEHC